MSLRAAPERSVTFPPTSSRSNQEAELQLTVVSPVRCCRRKVAGGSHRQVDLIMYCTSGLMSGCGLLQWVKTERTAARSSSTCHTQVTVPEHHVWRAAHLQLWPAADDSFLTEAQWKTGLHINHPFIRMIVIIVPLWCHVTFLLWFWPGVCGLCVPRLRAEEANPD